MQINCQCDTAKLAIKQLYAQIKQLYATCDLE